MVTTSITLTDQESSVLRAISQQTGKTQDELLREAVVQYLSQSQQNHRRALLQQAQGMWQDRTDLPGLDVLRRELDRIIP